MTNRIKRHLSLERWRLQSNRKMPFWMESGTHKRTSKLIDCRRFFIYLFYFFFWGVMKKKIIIIIIIIIPSMLFLFFSLSFFFFFFFFFFIDIEFKPNACEWETAVAEYSHGYFMIKSSSEKKREKKKMLFVVVSICLPHSFI